VAQADFADLTGQALGSGIVARGVSAAFTTPSGGGSFLYALNSVASSTGFAGKYVNLANFNPITGTRKAGSMTCAMKKYSSRVTFAPAFGIMKGTDPGSAEGYIVALTQETGYKIGLFKGSLIGGFSATAASTRLLRSSTTTYTSYGNGPEAWFHLRLDVLVNPHGEVVLNVYKNDLVAHVVGTPIWDAIPGMSMYVDDSVGVLSGALPHLDGFYCVFGMYVAADTGRTCFYDQLTCGRQLTP